MKKISREEYRRLLEEPNGAGSELKLLMDCLTEYGAQQSVSAAGDGSSAEQTRLPLMYRRHFAWLTLWFYEVGYKGLGEVISREFDKNDKLKELLTDLWLHNERLLCQLAERCHGEALKALLVMQQRGPRYQINQSLLQLFKQLLQPQPGDVMLVNNSSVSIRLGIQLLSEVEGLRFIKPANVNPLLSYMELGTSLLDYVEEGVNFLRYPRKDILRGNSFSLVFLANLSSRSRSFGAIGNGEEESAEDGDKEKLSNLERISNELLLTLNHLENRGCFVYWLLDENLQRGIEMAKKLRRELISTGRLRAVVRMPDNLVRLGVASDLLIFGIRSDARQVRMVDARKMTKGEGRFAELDNEAILQALQEDNDCSRSVSWEEIGQRGYNLSPISYFQQYSEQGKKLGELCDISRGMIIRREKLAELLRQEPTDCRYISLKDMQLEELLPARLNYIDISASKAMEKNSVKDKEFLLLTKNSPFKLVYVKNEEGKSFLVNGNSYIIRPKSPRLSLRLVEIYLRSEEGQEKLRNMAAGTTVVTFSMSELNELTLPVPDMEKQKELIGKYDELRSRKKMLLKRLKRLEQDMSGLAGLMY